MRRFLMVAVVLASCGGDEVEQTPLEPAPAPAQAPAAAEAPKPTGIGNVEAVQGEPTVQRGENKMPATVGMSVEAGDKLAVPKNAKVRVVLADKSVLALGGDTEARLAALNLEKGRKGQLELLTGKFWMQIQKWAGEGESTWDVTTPNAVAGVRGTTLWGDTKVDAICALDGQIEVMNTKNAKAKPVTLKAGNCASQLSKGKLKPLKPKPKQVQGFLDQVLIK